MSNNFQIASEVDWQVEYESVAAMGVYSGDRLAWIEQAIESILNQTYHNFLFVIVIDGFVEPETHELLKTLDEQHPNILLIYSANNIGLSRCMNFVIDWTIKHFPSVKYFFRMDADDICLHDRFVKQIQFFVTHAEISILGSSLIEINESGKVVGKRNLPSSHEEIVRILPKRCAINHPTVAIRMDVFNAGFRYMESLKNTQDYFLWAELCHHGYKFSNLPDVLLEFRRVNNFYKRRGFSKSWNEFKARFYVMNLMRRMTFGNVCYAIIVLFMRLMPSKIVKLAYKIDRFFLNKRVKH